jgi:hypothetical protein
MEISLVARCPATFFVLFLSYYNLHWHTISIIVSTPVLVVNIYNREVRFID